MLDEFNPSNKSELEDNVDKFAKMVREQSFHPVVGIVLLREKSADWIQQMFDLLITTPESTYENLISKMAVLLFPACCRSCIVNYIVK